MPRYKKKTAEQGSAAVEEVPPELGLYDIVADGVANQFADGMTIETPHDVGAVSLGGFDAQIQGRRDLLAALAFRQELDDLALARGKAIAGSLRIGLGDFLVEVAVQDHLSDAGGEEGLVAANGVDGVDEVAACIALEQVAPRAGAENFADEGIGFVHGEDQNA